MFDQICPTPNLDHLVIFATSNSKDESHPANVLATSRDFLPGHVITEADLARSSDRTVHLMEIRQLPHLAGVQAKTLFVGDSCVWGGLKKISLMPEDIV